MKMEKRLLKLSAVGGLFFAVLGLAWGLGLNSEMLFFDGLYSLISLLLSLLAIFICSYMDKNDKINFPFGKETLRPIVVIIKSTVLILMCSISLINSLKTIFLGGNSIEISFAILYTIISIIGWGSIYLYMYVSSKKINSDILKAESNQWLMDGLISLGVFIGFILVLILKRTSLSFLCNYIDPLMVIISSSLFLKFPITSLCNSFKEVIRGKASDDIYDQITKVVKDIENEYSISESVTRVSKIGNMLRIEIDFILSKHSKIDTIEEMDKIRDRVEYSTNTINLKKWLNISFTRNRKWAV